MQDADSASEAASELLLAFHTHHICLMAQHVKDIAKEQSAGCSAPPAMLDMTINAMRDAAHLVHDMLQANAAATAATAPRVAALTAARADLEFALSMAQAGALREVTLAELTLSEERARCAPRPAQEPPEQAADSTAGCTRDAALQALSPVEPPPELSGLSVHDAAVALHAWAGTCRRVDAANAGNVVCSTVHAWFLDHALRGFSGPPLNDAALAAVSELVVGHRRHLQQLRSSSCGAVSSAELLGANALIAWIELCLAHRAVAAEWPQVTSYSLPVYADDLRRLALGSAAEMQAALRVAEYVSAHCGNGRTMFSTADGCAATWELADEFARGSAGLQTVLEHEHELAEQRNAALWAAVEAKWAQLQVQRSTACRTVHLDLPVCVSWCAQ